MTVNELIEVLQNVKDKESLIMIPEHYTESRYTILSHIEEEPGEVIMV